MPKIVEIGAGGPEPFTGIEIYANPKEFTTERCVVLEPENHLCLYNSPNAYTEEIAQELNIPTIRADIYQSNEPQWEQLRNVGFIVLENVLNDPSFFFGQKNYSKLAEKLQVIVEPKGIILVSHMRSMSERIVSQETYFLNVMDQSGFLILLNEFGCSHVDSTTRLHMTLETLETLGIADKALRKSLSKVANNMNSRWLVMQKPG